MKRGLSVLLGATILATSINLNAQSTTKNQELQNIQDKVTTLTNKNVMDKRALMTKEAVETIQQTVLALQALDDGKKQEAIDILAKVSGKIDLLVARDPSLKLLPVSVSHKSVDVLVTKEMIKSLLYDAKKALDDGKVQEARHMLKDLASEIVITTTSIPLATYPHDIKAIAPLIDKGKIEEAKVALQEVLNSLVVSEQIIPLPVLRATYLLKDAESLVSKQNRTKDDNKKLDMLLKNAVYQLQMAELLGYGSEKEFDSIYKQIDIIKEKSSNNNSGKGWFDTLKEKLSHLL